MSPFPCIILAIFGSILQTQATIPFPTFWQPSLQINATELVDTVLNHVRQEVVATGLDDVRLPNISIKLFNQSLSITNQSAKGLANVYRVGDVNVQVTLLNTRFRSAFAIYNVSSDSDIEIHTNFANYSNGHVHSDCDNVTAYQVYKLSHLTQTLTLDEFELTVGRCTYNVSGLGDRASNGSAMLTDVFTRVKDPLAAIFSASLKILINSGLAAVRTALLG